MKKQIELTCATCGKKFLAEADYILPGISGYVTNTKGEKVTFIDPTAEHHCAECILEALTKAEENKKAAFEMVKKGEGVYVNQEIDIIPGQMEIGTEEV